MIGGSINFVMKYCRYTESQVITIFQIPDFQETYKRVISVKMNLHLDLNYVSYKNRRGFLSNRPIQFNDLKIMYVINIKC